MADMSPDQKAMFDAVITGFDRMAHKLYGGMARIFGALAGKGEEPYAFGIVGSTGGSGGGDGYVNLAATIGNSNTASIRISQEADFVCTRMHAISLTTSTGVIQPPQLTTGPSWSVQIKDGGADRTLYNLPLHNETVFGNAQLSYPLAKNRLFRRNATISFTFTNLQAVVAQIWLALIGYKIYDQRALDLVGKR